MWECPDFFALGDRHALIISSWDKGQLHYSVAMVGSYRDQPFVPDVVHKLDYGDRHFYAPQSFTDAQGRRIIFGWIHEGRGAEAQLASRLVGGDVAAARPIAWRRRACLHAAGAGVGGAARRAHAIVQLSTCRPGRSSLYRTSAAIR